MHPPFGIPSHFAHFPISRLPPLDRVMRSYHSEYYSSNGFGAFKYLTCPKLLSLIQFWYLLWWKWRWNKFCCLQWYKFPLLVEIERFKNQYMWSVSWGRVTRWLQCTFDEGQRGRGVGMDVCVCLFGTAFCTTAIPFPVSREICCISTNSPGTHTFPMR